MPVGSQPGRRKAPADSDDGLDGYAGSALYLTRDVYGPDLRGILRSWAWWRGTEETALAAVYGSGADVALDIDAVDRGASVLVAVD